MHRGLPWGSSVNGFPWDSGCGTASRARLGYRLWAGSTDAPRLQGTRPDSWPISRLIQEIDPGSLHIGLRTTGGGCVHTRGQSLLPPGGGLLQLLLSGIFRIHLPQAKRNALMQSTQWLRFLKGAAADQIPNCLRGDPAHPPALGKGSFPAGKPGGNIPGSAIEKHRHIRAQQPLHTAGKIRRR